MRIAHLKLRILNLEDFHIFGLILVAQTFRPVLTQAKAWATFFKVCRLPQVPCRILLGQRGFR
jgi:hypothetical protein